MINAKQILEDTHGKDCEFLSKTSIIALLELAIAQARLDGFREGKELVMQTVDKIFQTQN